MNDREDICMENQKVYCKNNNLPLFAHSVCGHDNQWSNSGDQSPSYTLTDMLTRKYDSLDKAIKVASSEHIISCPVCWRSWCD